MARIIDAARSNPACHLRLGVDPATVSRLLSRFEWPDTMTFAGRVVETRFGVSMLDNVQDDRVERLLRGQPDPVDAVRDDVDRVALLGQTATEKAGHFR